MFSKKGRRQRDRACECKVINFFPRATLSILCPASAPCTLSSWALPDFVSREAQYVAQTATVHELAPCNRCPKTSFRFLLSYVIYALRTSASVITLLLLLTLQRHKCYVTRGKRQIHWHCAPLRSTLAHSSSPPVFLPGRSLVLCPASLTGPSRSAVLRCLGEA